MFYVDITQPANRYNIRYGQGQNEEEAIRSALINLFPDLKNDLLDMELGYSPDDIDAAIKYGYDFDFVIKQSQSIAPIADVSQTVVLAQCSPELPGYNYWTVDKIIYNPTPDDIIKNCILLARPKVYIDWLDVINGGLKNSINEKTTLGDILYAYTRTMAIIQDSPTFIDFNKVYQSAMDLLPVVAMKDGAGNLKFNGVFLVRKPMSFYPLQFIVSQASKLEAIELLNLVRLFETTDDLKQLLNYFNFYQNRIEVT